MNSPTPQAPLRGSITHLQQSRSFPWPRPKDFGKANPPRLTFETGMLQHRVNWVVQQLLQQPRGSQTSAVLADSSPFLPGKFAKEHSQCRQRGCFPGRGHQFGGIGRICALYGGVREGEQGAGAYPCLLPSHPRPLSPSLSQPMPYPQPGDLRCAGGSRNFFLKTLPCSLFSLIFLYT